MQRRRCLTPRSGPKGSVSKGGRNLACSPCFETPRFARLSMRPRETIGYRTPPLFTGGPV